MQCFNFLKIKKIIKNKLKIAAFIVEDKCARNKYLNLYKLWKKKGLKLRNGKKIIMRTVNVW